MLIFWYQKIYLLISKMLIIYWYQKIIFWYQKRNIWCQKIIFDIRTYKGFSYIKNSNFWYRICDIKKSKLFHDIRKWAFDIKKSRFSDIRKWAIDTKKSNSWILILFSDIRKSFYDIRNAFYTSRIKILRGEWNWAPKMEVNVGWQWLIGLILRFVVIFP